MGKTNFKIFLCILFTSGCSQKIAAQCRNESNAKNVTEQDDDTNFQKRGTYEIVNCNDHRAEVS